MRGDEPKPARLSARLSSPHAGMNALMGRLLPI